MLERSTAKYVLTLWLSDLLLTVAALYIAEGARLRIPLGKPLFVAGGTPNWIVFVAILFIWTGLFLAFSTYDPYRILEVPEEIQRVVLAIVVAVFTLSGLLFFSYRGVSRLLVVYFLLADLALVPLGRVTIRFLVQRFRGRRVAERRVLVLGTGQVAQEVAATVRTLRWAGLEMVGFLALDPSEPEVAGCRVLGTVDEARRVVTDFAVDEVIIALPLESYHAVPNLVYALHELPVNVKIVPDFLPLAFFRTTMEDLGGLPLIGLKEPMIRGVPRRIKRLTDVAISLPLLVLLAPVGLLVALLIRLDSPGPIILKQERVGENGTPFLMYKFRTMVEGADTMTDDDAPFRKEPDDPRITRVGRVLRRLSLDEAPQLLNVLRGEMSLVGPRPELPFLVDRYRRWQRKRFSVPPGMTGWWQVNARSDQPMHLHTEDDLYYIQNYSLLLDLQILWKTIWVVLRGKGAY
jgi:exopolysaccharide biosynthesis polyprenyl glycosylphosphotransferase